MMEITLAALAECTEVRMRIALNTVYFKTLQSEAHRSSVPFGIPIAGDDPEELE